MVRLRERPIEEVFMNAVAERSADDVRFVFARVPREMHKELRLCAVEEDVPMADIVRRCIAQ
jgi:hypothetical protein